MDNIINYFIKEPYREFHVRELAKLTKKSPTTVSKNLNQFKKDEILVSKKELNHLFFKANAESKNFKELKLSYNLKSLRESNLLGYLIKEFNYPEAIVLFGSFRKAEDTPKSDIDIVVITLKKKELELSKFEKIVGHKIQLFLYSKDEIERMKTKNRELLNNIINGIVLEGFLEVFR